MNKHQPAASAQVHPSDPVERARNAARRALTFGCFTYKGVSQILLKGLDMAPLPTENPPNPAPEQTPKQTPTYARDLASMLSQHSPKEDSHDWN